MFFPWLQIFLFLTMSICYFYASFGNLTSCLHRKKGVGPKIPTEIAGTGIFPRKLRFLTNTLILLFMNIFVYKQQ